MFSSSGIPRVCMCSMSRRPSVLGTDISNSRSNLPGRRSADSMLSGRLEAPSTMTLPRSSRPSIRASSWATTLFSTSPYASSRFGAMASISSMKIMLGAFSLASWNISRRRASVSP